MTQPISMIKTFLVEADQFTLPADSPENQPNLEQAANVEDVLASSAPPASPAPDAVAGQLDSSLFPQVTAGQGATIQKTVLNRDLVLAVFSELKSIIANYEKKFSREDVALEDAKIYLGSLLNTLAFNAKKLEQLISAEELPEAEPEEPKQVSQSVYTEPEAAVTPETTAPVTNPLDSLGEL